MSETNTSSLINFFDKTYIINLLERTDRRQEISEELARMGSSIRDSKVVIFPAIKPTELAGFPSLGARGCFLSHLEILKHAHGLGLQRVLILEDDLVFSSLLLQRQDELVAQLRQTPWGLVYLGHLVKGGQATSIGLEKYIDPLQQSHFIGVSGPTLPALIQFLETVLSRPAGHPDGGPMHVDGAYSTFRQQQPSHVTFIAQPSLGFQRPSPSDIAGYQWFDRIPVLSSAVAAVRRLKTRSRR